MAIGDYIKNRGSRWKRIRKEIVKDFPFCAICGTTKNLQVHHITPYRLTHDNSKQNLIPLCRKHHKWVEMMFCDTERHGTSEATRFIWKSILRERQMATATVIKRLEKTNTKMVSKNIISAVIKEIYIDKPSCKRYNTINTKGKI